MVPKRPCILVDLASVTECPCTVALIECTWSISRLVSCLYSSPDGRDVYWAICQHLCKTRDISDIEYTSFTIQYSIHLAWLVYGVIHSLSVYNLQSYVCTLTSSPSVL